MAQSEQSKTVAVKTGWINYQILFMNVPESDVSMGVPQQFRDIFLIGYALGEERGKRNAGRNPRAD